MTPFTVPPTPFMDFCIDTSGVIKSDLYGDIHTVAQLSICSNTELVSKGVLYFDLPSVVNPCIAMMKGDRGMLLNQVHRL
jgi:hypothetical protein